MSYKKITVCTTTMVDKEYAAVDGLPDNWDGMDRRQQEAWLLTNTMHIDTRYTQFVSIDDGSWLIADDVLN